MLGNRKDLSLLLLANLYPEYNEGRYLLVLLEGPLIMPSVIIIFIKIRNDGGRNYLKTSDFWDDAKVDIPNSQANK